MDDGCYPFLGMSGAELSRLGSRYAKYISIDSFWFVGGGDTYHPVFQRDEVEFLSKPRSFVCMIYMRGASSNVDTCIAGKPGAQVPNGRRDKGYDEGALAGRPGSRGTLR